MESREAADACADRISSQEKELEKHRQTAKDLAAENSRLRDDLEELDVLKGSGEKLSAAEEQLRRCHERIDLMGDVDDALRREKEAHEASVDRCIVLEKELVHLKELRRQVDEYRAEAAEAKVSLAECQEELSRASRKVGGLEAECDALRRGASLQQAEASNLQRQLQDQGGKAEGTAVGVGMRYVQVAS